MRAIHSHSYRLGGVLAALLHALMLGSAVAANAELLIVNARVFNGRDAELSAPSTLRVSEGRIVSITAGPPTSSGGAVIDAGNRVVIPGIIDAHVHPSIPLGFTAMRDLQPDYAAHRSAAVHSRRAVRRDLGPTSKSSSKPVGARSRVRQRR